MNNIKEVTINELVKSVAKAQEVLDETQASIKVLKDEIHDRLVKMKITGTKVDNYYVSRVRRMITSDVSMGQAREIGAVKEAIDTNKLSQLVKKGIKIKGIKWAEYVNIRKSKNE